MSRYHMANPAIATRDYTSPTITCCRRSPMASMPWRARLPIRPTVAPGSIVVHLWSYTHQYRSGMVQRWGVVTTCFCRVMTTAIFSVGPGPKNRNTAVTSNPAARMRPSIAEIADGPAKMTITPLRRAHSPHLLSSF